ncbi:MAG: right-handed parallel beta-helix repeat-containing protein [Candidatus Heimdallarchaeaceae archaeon]
MKNNKNKIIVVLVLSVLVFSISLSESEYQILRDSSNALLTNTPEMNTYIYHEPLKIISDSNFTDYGLSGYGNITHPYIIENLNITTYDQDAILIQDTTKHFLIRNCKLTGLRGIRITNAGDNTISITDNTITHCNYTAIWIRESVGLVLHNNILRYKSCRIILSDTPYSSVVNNSCFWGQIDIASAEFSNVTDNICAGIVCADCRYIVLKNNLCKNTMYGIKIEYSPFSKIQNNTCINCNVGLSIQTSSNSLISNNYVSNSIYTGISSHHLSSSNFTNNICEYNLDVGMSFSAGEYLLVKNNTCNYNGLYGIDIFDSEFDVNEPSDFVNNFCEFNGIGIRIKDANRRIILNNTFSNNLEYGMYLEYASYNLIHYNIMESNSEYGIFSTWSWENEIYYNDFINNNANMPSRTSQSYDEGFKNHWYNEENQIGNYWDNHIEGGYYTIDGGENFVDLYPHSEPFRYENTHISTQDTTETSFLNLNILVILLIPIFAKTYITIKSKNLE